LITTFLTAQAAGDCELVPPAGWVVAVGYGRGNEADARREAREDAHQRLIGQICSGQTASRCADLGRYVRDWQEGVWENRKVCALAGAERVLLERRSADQAKLDATLAKAARDVAARAGTDALHVVGLSGPESRLFRSQLLGALGGAGVILRDSGDSGPELRVELSSQGDLAAVTMTYRTHVGGDFVIIQSFTASGDTVGIDQRMSAKGPQPVTSVVHVGGRAVEETHWVDGCSALGPLEDRAARIGGRADIELGNRVTGHLNQARVLCQQYERFAISAEEYGRQLAALDQWLQQADSAVTSGKAGSIPATPVAVPPRRLEPKVLRTADKHELKTGDPVTHGDRLRFFATVDGPAHLYLVFENSAGEKMVMPERPEGLVVSRAGEYALPSADQSIQVDNHKGRVELVHVISSPVALGDPASAPARARSTRGFSVVADPVYETDQSTEAWYGDPEATAHGYGAVTVTFAFPHQ
jgi:hypothetical protein